MIVQGDANLCSNKWLEVDFELHSISNELLSTLALCGMTTCDLGNTYLADRLSPNGETIESALDHVYFSDSVKNRIESSKLKFGSTDHVPILTKIEHRSKKKKLLKKKVTKRSMKNFNHTNWIKSLINKNWESLGEMDSVNDMALQFSNLVNEALDEIAPVKTFNVKDNYVQGLTEETKLLMNERDKARLAINRAAGEKWIALKKYKTLRNRVTQKIRTDAINANGKKIDEATSESDYWKVVNDIVKPNGDSNWKLKEEGKIIEDEKEIAETMNDFFVNKIEDLKVKIDDTLKSDPLEQLKKKVERKNLKFSLKTVSVKAVTKIMKKMKKKKSSGTDGVTQECLLTGSDVLAVPLTHIINTSIRSGEVPAHWKEAIVVPILKKGDKLDKNNYRPVSCLIAASKVMEKVICNQVTRFLEVNGLLPDSQHGFRQSRSTMTALSAMQKEWIKNTEDGLTTGILVWDLSAAFDTVDTDLLCAKLGLYGFDKLSCAWFKSYLTDRSQKVRIGSTLSESRKLVSGVPQGGTLSPIVFTVYTADLNLWVKKSSVFNYADDTTSDVAHKHLEMVLKHLEVDADAILSFMASNGLVANSSKTVFMLLNHIDKNVNRIPVSIRVGRTTIEQETSTKLLGMTIESNQNWKEHFFGKSGLISALNKRLFAIRRVANHIPHDKLKQLAHALWISKLRYGLQLCTEVRLCQSEPTNGNMKALQIAQNKLLRLLDNSTLSERKSTESLLENTGLLSVNQLAASIKLTEVWKSIHQENYPISLEPNNPGLQENDRILRASSSRLWNQDARSRAEKESFSRNAAKIWNAAPLGIKNASALNSAKRVIKIHCKTLPI